MTELAVYQSPQAVSLVDYSDRAIQRLGEWAQSADAAYRVAQRLVSTSFCPVAYRGKPEEATAAILSGMEVGLSPMAALRAFDVIQGQAAPRAITLRAIALSHGHDMILTESTATRCKMRGRRRGSQEWQPITWTLDRARDLGLLGKDPWKKQPQAMLLARATSELARLIAADAILGIGYSAEEIADGGAIDTPVVSLNPATDSEQSGSRRMSRPRKVAAVPDAEPEAEDAPSDEEVAPDEPAEEYREITKAQLVKMHACFTDRKYSRDQGIAFIAQILGFAVESSKNISLEEASLVINALEDEVALDA